MIRGEKIYIGIDPGKNTGLAVWNSTKECFQIVGTYLIHQAFQVVKNQCVLYGEQNVFVIFEDARQRKWFGDNSNEKVQGAGSVKRDSTIWEDFLTDNGIPFRAIPPQVGGTKWDAGPFKRITGWTKRTSEHSRDAALMVFGK